MSDKRGHKGSTFLDNDLTDSRVDIVDARHLSGNSAFDLTTNHLGFGGQDDDLSFGPTGMTGMSYAGSQLPVQDLDRGHGLSPDASASSNGFHAPPPVVPVFGQLWYGGQGSDAGTSSGSSDNQVGHLDSDQAGRDVSDVDTQDSDAGFQSIGLDTSAGMYFAMDGAGLLRSGHITNNTQTNESSQFGTTPNGQVGTELQLTDSTNQDEDNAIAVDPVNHFIYTEIWGKDDDTTAIIKISYDPTTGIMTSPYNSSTGNLTAGSNVVATYNTTGGKLVDVTAMSFDIATGKLYYIDDDLGYNHNFGANEVWGPTKNIYVIDTTNANPSSTLTQLTTGMNATDANTYIAGFAVDEAKGIIYYAIDNVSAHTTQIFWMPITGGAGTAMTIPGGVTLGFETYFGSGSNGMAIDQNSQTLYVANSTGPTGSTNGNIVQLTLASDGHSFTSGNGSFEGFDTNGNNGNTGALLFDNQAILGSMSATTTEAVQGGSALGLLTSAPTITEKGDNHLGFFQVVDSNAQSGDVLSATASGGITVSFNSATHTLTLSGDASFAAYQTVLDTVTFLDTGTDNSTGSHPVRTIDWIASDGTTLTDQTTADANEQSTTVVIDRAPTLTADNYAVLESATSSGTSGTGGTGVLGNDTDKDADAITITAVNGNGANVGNSTAGTYGHLTLSANGSFTYIADNTTNIDNAATGSHPVDTFTYTVSDGLGGVSTTTVSFTIDRPPTVVADSGAAVESASGNGNVLTNDSDKDGDTLVVSAVNGSGANVGVLVAGTYGHINIASNGSYTYNADNTVAIDSAATGAHLTDTFTYTDSDGHGGSTTTTITVTLDRPPTVVADSGAAVESASGAGNVLTNDSDRDGDTLVVSAVNGNAGNVGNSVAGTYGHMTIAANGGYTYNADNTTAINSAATGSHLTDTFSYTASDGHGGTMTTNIVITLDRPPTVVNDGGSDVEGATLNVLAASGVIANDSDRDGDTLTVSAVGGSGANVGNSFATTYGHITLNADGSYSYVADNTAAIDSAATGSHPVDTISVTVSDGHGGSTNETLGITIDRAPTVTPDAGAAVESSSGSGNVLTNDSDKDGDTLVVSAVNGLAGNVGSSVAGTYGHINIASNGSYTYTADNTVAIDGAATGSHLTDTFSYTANDGHGGTTTTSIVVTLDRAPTVVSDAPASDALESGSAVNGNVLANDSDRDGDTLVVSAVNGVGGNVGSSVAGTYGHLTINSDGSYSYSADNTVAIDGAATGSHLTDTFSYTASDGLGGTTSTTITVTLDRAPSVVNDNGGTVSEGGSGSENAASGVLANDSDRDGDTLAISAVGGSAGNVGNSFATTYGHVTLNADGSYSYTADNTTAIDAAANGSHPVDTVTFTASDGFGGFTDETLSFTLDRPAVANADSLDTSENTTATVGSGSPVNPNLLANDADKDGDAITITAVNGSGANVGTQITLASGALLTVNADGSYVYDPNHAFDYLPGAASGASNTAATDTFTYTVDGGSTVTVTVNVNGVDSNDTLIGTTGNDTIHGGIGNDIIYDDNGLSSGTDPLDTSAGHSGGTDTFFGDSGNDTFFMGANLTAADQIDGGTNIDTVVLNGDYSGGLVFNATTMVNVEFLNLTAGHSYNLTMDNATVAAGQTLTVRGGLLGAGDTLTFDGSADTTGGNFVINSGAGNDVLTGGNGNDVFRVGSGNDTVHGGGGDDRVNFGAALTAADSFDGGTGNDTVYLKGDYSAGLVLGATTLVSVETLELVAGDSYNLTMNAATVAAGDTLTVRATSLMPANSLTFDGSADTAGGNFVIFSGSGNDVLTGGAGNDQFNPGSGIDTVHGGGGDDVITMGGALTAADTIDGGTGNDTVFLNGDYSGGLTFGATTISNVERITLTAGHSYNLTIDNATVAAGQIMTLAGNNLGASDSFVFDGSNDTSGGSLAIAGGAGDDTLTGGWSNDVIRAGNGTNVITGGGGSDILAGGSGADTFVYNSVSDSTSTHFDKVTNFDASADTFKLTGMSVSAVDTAITSGHLSGAHFDTDLSADVNGTDLAAHHAVLFTADSGNLSGHTFLVVDVNGVAGYQAGQDIVIDLTGATHLNSLSVGNFVT